MLALAAACGPRAAPRAPDLAHPAADLAVDYLPVTSAGRCEECHGKMAMEWKSSSHAAADRGPLYQAMRNRAVAAACDHCHAPFAGKADPDEAGAHEGVTCDACHTISAVTERRAGGGFELRTREPVKYGPLCDAKDHYFHKMGCSPLHEKAELCSACHHLYRAVPGGEIPVFTEYDEWKEGPYADEGLDCQRCHMPGTRGEVARGAPPRPSVPHHGFLGRDGTLRRHALTVRVSVKELASGGGRLEVTAVVTNRGAGHKVPTGLPERRVLLRVRALDDAGAVQAEGERVYGRVLTDGEGTERPFYTATRVGSDNRLAPRESRIERFELAAKDAGHLAVQVVWRDAAESIAKQLGVTPTDQLLMETQLAFGPATTSGRRRLPAAVTLGEP